MVLGLLPINLGEFVLQTYGPSIWAEALKGCQTPLCGPWVSSCPYHDNIFFNLMDTISELVHETQYDFGRRFGSYFIRAVSLQGYGKLMSRLGRTFVDFLCGLNNLHLHLSLGAPAFLSPDFRVKQVTATTVELQYRSKRPGMSSHVVGILEAVAVDYYDMHVHFQLLRGRDDGSCDHEVWLLSFPEQKGYFSDRTMLSALSTSALYQPEPSLFFKLFPFHILVDEQLRLVQFGSGLARNIQGLKAGGMAADFFQITVPYTSWDLSILSGLDSSCFLLRTKEGLEIKGGFDTTVLPDGNRGLLFTGSPRVASLDELEYHGMYMSDIPSHDMSSDFVVMAEQRQIEADLAKKLEEDKAGLQQAAALLKAEVEDSEAHIAQLRESLECALTARSLTPLFDADTPAEKTLQLIDKLMKGDEVKVNDILVLRDAILSSGQDMRRPINLRQRMKGINRDTDVNRSLMIMLDVGEEDESGSEIGSIDGESGSTSGEDEDRDLGVCLRRLSSLPPRAPQVPHSTTKQVKSIGRRSEGEGTLKLVSRTAAAARSTPPRSSSSIVSAVAACLEPASALGSVSGSSRRSLDAVSSLSFPSRSPFDNTERSSRTSFTFSLLSQASSPPHQIDGSSVFGKPDIAMLVKCPNDETLSLLSHIGEWDFDCFCLDKLTEGHPLSTLAYAIMKRNHLVSGRGKMNEARLIRFLCCIEDGYPDNPYHNRIHAASVLSTLYAILTQGGVLHAIRASDHHEMDLLLAIFSAIVHDFGHLGVNNDFLVKSSDDLAILYNDRSPMENHHISAAFRVLKDESLNCLHGMSSKAHATLRRHAIDMVLATDMKQHFALISMFSTKLLLSNPALGTGNSRGIPIPPPPTAPRSEIKFTQDGRLSLNGASGNQTKILKSSGPSRQQSGSLWLFDSRCYVGGQMQNDSRVDVEGQQQSDSGQGVHPQAYSRRQSGSLAASGGNLHFGSGVVIGTSVPMSRDESIADGLSSLDKEVVSVGRNGSEGLTSPPGRNLKYEAPPPISGMDEETRSLVLQMALKCADLGHLTCPWPVHRQWVTRLESEFFLQGDRERQTMLPVSPLMDRHKAGITKSQTGFFTIVAIPMYQSFCSVFPACNNLLSATQKNHSKWLSEETFGIMSTILDDN